MGTSSCSSARCTQSGATPNLSAATTVRCRQSSAPPRTCRLGERTARHSMPITAYHASCLNALSAADTAALVPAGPVPPACPPARDTTPSHHSSSHSSAARSRPMSTPTGVVSAPGGAPPPGVGDAVPDPEPCDCRPGGAELEGVSPSRGAEEEEEEMWGCDAALGSAPPCDAESSPPRAWYSTARSRKSTTVCSTMVKLSGDSDSRATQASVSQQRGKQGGSYWMILSSPHTATHTCCVVR
mmetsp:Transcript_14170/g.34974  ORF Transcript_14170/g.34974 Transcript_14170/m.34974 type:complete len:242 (-) Transcript_14170:370-1095(-)